MSEDGYVTGIQALYDGEVRGEKLLLALYAAAKSPHDAWHFATILQLETETKARLRPLLIKHGMSPAETADLSDVPARVAGYVDQDWRAYAAASAAHLRVVLTRYEAIAIQAPPEDQAILQAVVRHEAALLTWARTEADGPSADSLAEIIAMLNFPAYRPA